MQLPNARRCLVLAVVALLTVVPAVAAPAQERPVDDAKRADADTPGEPTPRTFTHPEDVVIQGPLTIDWGINSPQVNLVRSGSNAAHWRVRSTAGDLDLFDVANNWLPFFISDGLNASGVSMALGSFGLNLGSAVATGSQFFPNAVTLGTPNATGIVDILNSTGRANFYMKDLTQAKGWFFGTRGTGFEVNLDGSGGNEFRILGNGRVTMGPGPVTAFDLSPNGNLTILGSLTQGSDRAAKAEMRAVNRMAVLQAVRDLEVSTWRYTTDPARVRHMGPTAQDFAAAFGLGADPTGIAAIDADGVALAAIQALADENEALRAGNAELAERLERLERLVAELSVER